MIPYAKQSIDDNDRQNVVEALNQDFITRGPKVEAFEKAIASYCGAQYAVAFNSGTTALFACCYAAQVNQFDRLIVSPNTFVASVGCAAGATPVFVDIERTTGNFNLEQVNFTLQKPFSRGRPVIMAVHFAGRPVDMQKLDLSICHPDAIVIEDAAHAIGSEYPSGEKVGSCAFSHMTMFSFHPAKTITTGEGGMVTTNDPELYHRLLAYRNNGIEREQRYLVNPHAKEAVEYYEVQDITGNFHMTDMQAALGLSQLARIDKFIEKRRKLVRHYRHLLKDARHVAMFDESLDAKIAPHLFVVQIDYAKCKTTREKVISHLKDKGIGTQVHYIPVYRHPYYVKQCGDIREFFPENEKYYEQALSLPLYYDLDFKDVERVCQVLKGIL